MAFRGVSSLKHGNWGYVHKKSYLALEFTVSAVSYNAVLAFAAIPDVLMRAVNINTEGFAFYSSIFILALMVSSFPAGVLASRFGSVRVVLAGQIVIGLSSLLFGLTSNYAIQIVARATLGMGSSLWWIASPENIVSTFGRKNSAVPITFWLSGYATGAAVSYPLTAFGANLVGWHPVFVLYGAASLLVALVYHLRVRQLMVNPRSLDQAQGSCGKVAEYSDKHSEPQVGFEQKGTHVGRTVLSYLRKKWVVLVGSAMLLQFFTWFGVLTFFPLYLTQEGFSLLTSGALGFLLVVFGAPAFVLGGIVAAKLNRTAPILLLGLALLSTVGFIPFTVLGHAKASFPLYVVLAAIGIGLALPDIAWTFLSEVLPVPGGGSISFGFVNSFGLIGAILGTTLTPFLASAFGWETVWLIYAISVVGSFVVGLSIRKEENKWFASADPA
jgi:ACS family glucarate transporter-like MFS transporter